jgi:flavin reductase (DIM6/NTAB) family NADH-FMN oxidoreductase RutF
MQNLQGDKVDTWMVFGQVIGVHIDERLIPNGIYDTANAGHVLRGGGAADYFTIGPEQLFKMYRPESGARDLPK